MCYYEGAIELSILVDYYGREIAAYDIQTSRCDLYGQVRTADVVSLFLSLVVVLSLSMLTIPPFYYGLHDRKGTIPKESC